jgi:hypothetical protein
MARYAIGGTATIAGSATLPFVSLYSTAAVNPRVREIHVYNTTATGGFVVALCRLSSTGHAGRRPHGDLARRDRHRRVVHRVRGAYGRADARGPRVPEADGRRDRRRCDLDVR